MCPTISCHFAIHFRLEKIRQPNKFCWLYPTPARKIGRGFTVRGIWATNVSDGPLGRYDVREEITVRI